MKNLKFKIIFLGVLLVSGGWMSGQALSLKQIKRAPDSLMTIYTDAQGYQTYRYLRDVAGKVDSVFAKTDSICYVVKSDTTCFYFSSGSKSIDSTALESGFGIYAYEVSPNVWIIESDTLQIPTNWDIDQLDLTLWDSLYNGNRQISRVPAVGNNLNATTFREWINWWYIGNYTVPVISLGSLSTPVEVGTSNGYTLSGSTSNPCSFTLSGGTVNGNSFGSNTSYSYSYTHAPTSHGTTTITAQQNWDQSGTICQTSSPTTGVTSASRSISNVYPVLWGMSATSYTSGSVPYNIWSKKSPMQGEANYTGLTMTGTNMYIYILFLKVGQITI
ncbi:MAG: hypothetical protein IPN67_19970 [Bacteroidales bacterium]|nr:hypothetical protein [Bacteroidales bacterium]